MAFQWDRGPLRIRGRPAQTTVHDRELPLWAPTAFRALLRLRGSRLWAGKLSGKIEERSKPLRHSDP